MLTSGAMERVARRRPRSRCVYREAKTGRSGDEVHQGSRV